MSSTSQINLFMSFHNVFLVYQETARMPWGSWTCEQ